MNGRVVSVARFTVDKDTFAAVSREAGLIMQRRLPAMPGFMGGTLLTNEANTQILAMTEWESRHSWAAAQWDEDVARTVSDLFSGTAPYELEFFYPLVKVSTEPAS